MTPDGATLHHPLTKPVREQIGIQRAKPVEPEPHVLLFDSRDIQIAQPQTQESGSPVLRYVVYALLAAGAVYFVSTASLLALWIAGGVLAAVVALLVGICIYVQNNSLI
ncbi:MAG: hypothetical protein HOP95_00060 [Sphingomonas sp.]|nr:hypothetical protein [Sphingomonas sp.]